MSVIGSIIAGTVAGLLSAGVFISLFRDERIQERDAMMRRIHEAEEIVKKMNERVNKINETVENDYAEFAYECDVWEERWRWIRTYLNHCLRKLKEDGAVWEAKTPREKREDEEEDKRLKEAVTLVPSIQNYKFEEPDDDPDNPRS